MAELLYKIGKWCARHGKSVVGLWLAVLILVGGGLALTGVKLSDQMDVGTTATTQVADRITDVMAKQGDDAGTDAAQVIFRTEDGKAFTSAQKKEIGANLKKVEALAPVGATTNPFSTQDEVEDARTKLADGKKKIADGEQQLTDGQKKLDAAEKQVADGKKQLAAAKKQMAASGAPAAMIKQQLAPQQAKLDAAQKQIDTQATKLSDAKKKLADSKADLERNQKLFDLSSKVSLVSDDGSAALATVSFKTSDGFIQKGDQDKVTALLDEHPVNGVQTALSGSQAPGNLVGVGEIAGVVFAAIVLVVMLGTLIAAGLPLISALVGVGIGASIAMLIGHVTDVASVTPVLGIMLGLAVGIDYSLFIVNRHRRQLKQGNDVVHSVALATGTSGNAVVFAGLTVVIALLALNISGLPFLGLMGTLGAISVAVAVLIAVTMTPALLGLVGLRVLRRKERAVADAADPVAAVGAHRQDIKPFPMWAAAVTVVLAAVVLIVSALPVLQMRTNLPTNGSEPHDSPQYIAYSTIEDKFSPGLNGPLVVVADLPDGLSKTEATDAQIKVGQQLAKTDDVHAVAPILLSKDRTEALFQVIPEDGPDAQSTQDLVNELRDHWTLSKDYPIGVAGTAAANIDMSAKIVGALPLYLTVVVGLSFLILVLVFRSLLVPLIATLGFVLSYLAALGATVAVYQWGWLSSVFGVTDPGPILSFLPTILVGVLFGLAMDYMFFLGSGMREAYASGIEARKAVSVGVHAGRSVVIAAAIIMTSVFAGFIFSELAMIRPMGFAMAVGVVADAFLVRLVIVPSLMTLLGKAAWWMPKWLDRLVPNVDVEGSALEGRHTHPKTGEVPVVKS